MSNMPEMRSFAAVEKAHEPQTRTHGRWRQQWGRSVPVLLIVGLITGFATWLRLYHLGGHGLWLDEAYSVLFAQIPAGRFWKLMWNREGNMVLYYLLLRSWVHFGDSEFMLRLPSVIFAAMSIPMMYLLARDLFSKLTGIVAAALLSVHAFHLFFSQQARSYTLLTFLLLGSAWLFLRWSEMPERRPYRTAYAMVSAAAMYAQVLALLVVVSHWLSLVPDRARRMGRRTLFATVREFFLFALPMEAFVLLRKRGQLDWIPPLTLQGFKQGIYALAGYEKPIPVILYLGLAVLGAVCGARNNLKNGGASVRLAVLWVLFPMLMMLAYSIHRPLFVARYLIICVPAVILLAAEGIVTLKRGPPLLRWTFIPVLAFVVATALQADRNYFNARMWPDWKSATHMVVARKQAGDAICFNGNGLEPFLYYMQRETQADWNTLPRGRYSHGVECISDFPEQVAQNNSGYQRLWLFTTNTSPQQSQWVLKLFVPRFGLPQRKGLFPSPPDKIVVDLFPEASR